MTGNCALWLILGALMLAVNGVSASNHDSFRAELIAHASATAEGVDEWAATQFAFSARNVNSSLGLAPMTFGAVADSARVHRYEVSWNEARTSPNEEYRRTSDDLAPKYGNEDYQRAALEYTSQDPFATAIVVAQNGAINSHNRTLDVKGVARDPVVAGYPFNENHGAKFNPEERGRWSIPGNYLTLRHEGLEGNFSGTVQFYFSLGAVRLQTSDQVLNLESRIWSDPDPPGGLARVRHIVWYQIDAQGTNGKLAVPTPDGRLNSVGFSQSIAAEGLQALSVESFTKVEGSLPPSKNATSPSLWLSGPLDLHMVAQGSAPENERESYVITIAGEPTAYSVGGGVPTPLKPRPANVVPALSLVALALLFVRETVLHAATKAFFALYSKFDGAHVLSNPVRDHIYGIVKGIPGIHFSGIQKQLRDGDTPRKIRPSSLYYHLSYLETTGHLRSYRKGRFRRYFEAAGKGADFALLARLRNPPLPLLADIILQKQGISHNEVQAQMQTHGFLIRSTVRYHLRWLVVEGLVQRIPNGRQRHYYPTKKLLDLRTYLGQNAKGSAGTDQDSSKDPGHPASI